MNEWVKNIRNVDSILFHPKRLLIMSLLVAIGPLTQGEIQKKCQLTWGAVTAHLKQLQKVDYIKQKHILTLKGPRALVDATETGIDVYKRTLNQLNQFIADTKDIG